MGVATALFAVGWCAGWLLLWRARPLPGDGTAAARSAMSVVVPARDEAAHIATTVARLRAQLRPGDELVVVDDHSTDATAALAAAAGAAVVPAPPLPPGWAGKPHACHVGADRTGGQLLVFVDADVAAGPALLDGLAERLAAHPGELISVQPWHAVERAHEQWSVLFNVAALMGSAAFTPLGERVRTRVAFGPVMACTRDSYAAVGGHAAPEVRGAVLEDIALARRFPRSRLYVGSRSTTTFRMYPHGWRQVVEGWTKGIGIGVSATPWWALLGTIAWVASLCGGWAASPWFVPASLAQLAVLARRAGGFRWWAVVLVPVSAAIFVAVVVRSLWRRGRGGTVTWKGRRLVPDQETG